MSTSRIIVAGVTTAVLIAVGGRYLSPEHAAASYRSDAHVAHQSAAQATVGAIGAKPNANSLPVAIDGSIHPDQIPDRVAYSHFIATTAESAAASQGALDRQRSRLSALGLSAEDQRIYIARLRGVREHLDRISDQRQAILANHDTSASGSNLIALSTLRTEERSVFDDARADLQASLSQDGQNRLDAHIRNHVKRHIKIYGTVVQ